MQDSDSCQDRQISQPPMKAMDENGSSSCQEDVTNSRPSHPRSDAPRGRRQWTHSQAEAGKRNRHLNPDVDLSNPVLAQFQSYADSLDRRHDKHERIVKLSRDITIESKRVIFFLHRITSPDDMARMLKEAESKLNDIRRRLWYHVAKELLNEDHMCFLRAYTNGLQEYIEALSFLHYLKAKSLIPLKEVQSSLRFVKKIKSGPTETQKESSSDAHNPDSALAAQTDAKEAEGNMPPVPAHHSAEQVCDGEVMWVNVPPADYLLGIADLTGEIMRRAMNLVGQGYTEDCVHMFNFLQNIYDGFMGLSFNVHRDLNKKRQVMEQSVKKVEDVCYKIHVRSTEVPAHLLASYIEVSANLNDDDDMAASRNSYQ